MLFSRGNCILVETNYGAESKTVSHFHIVINNVEKTQDKVLFIPVDRIKPGRYFDRTAILFKGSHPFITQDSWVNYYEAKSVVAQVLLERLADGSVKLYPPDISDVICSEICEGISQSENVQPFFIEEYQANILSQ
jgi:hypothetical protein